MSLRLYEIADQYRELLNELYDEETGVVNETTLEALNELGDTLENKCINVTRFFKELEASADAIEKERKAMQKRETAIKNQIESLKNYLKINMEKCRIHRIECPQFIISLQKNPHSLDVYNENEIPHEYDKPQDRELDTKKIKSDLQNGVVIAGARLVQHNGVRIR